MEEGLKAIIFDFDGTLADSYLEALRTLYRIVHHRALPNEDISRLRGMTLWQLRHELGVPFWQLPLLLKHLRRAMRGRMYGIDPVSGIVEAIKRLSGKYKIFVQTSNDARNVQLELERWGIQNQVSAVYGNVGMLSKVRSLHKILVSQKLHASQVWYVGDEPRDIQAARRAHIKSVAVTWGFSNIERLKKTQPDAWAFSSDELICCFLHNYEK